MIDPDKIRIVYEPSGEMLFWLGNPGIPIMELWLDPFVNEKPCWQSIYWHGQHPVLYSRFTEWPWISECAQWERDQVYICGNPEQPGMLYWSHKSDPEKFPHMKLAIWETIKYRLRQWWNR